MNTHDYYSETIADAVIECGLPALSPEHLKYITEAVIGSVENESLAFGRDAIPNPLSSEIGELRKKLDSERREKEERERILKKEIAQRFGRPEDISVSIEHGGVRVERR